MGAGLLLTLALTQESNAQIQLGININISDQPRWRPAGYDYAEYYYLPDIETYYYVPQRQFIYMSNGRWVFVKYDLYDNNKVVIEHS